jgi:hypothetical protein
MRIKCLGCDALARMVYLSAAYSPHMVDVSLFQLGLHNHPADLRSQLQKEIDALQGQKYDAIVMAYGLCGQATMGLIARDIQIVIPRAHDCITLFLGSRESYKTQHEACPGTYWYTKDYIERGSQYGSVPVLGAGGVELGADMETVYDEYVRKYGKDNADYLMEVMGAWQANYQRAAFIDMKIGDAAATEERAQDEATRRGWTFERIEGNAVIIKRLLDGDWDKDFLILKPGELIKMAYDDEVIQAGTA